jgi:protease I
MAGRIEGRRVAFLVANEGVEQVELTEPWKAIEHAGGQPVLVAPEAGQVQAFNHLDRADRFSVDTTVEAADPHQFDALVLPGGVANPDHLRTEPAAVRFVRQMVDAGKPVAVICHGPWTLIDAGAVAGRRLTSWPSLSTDITNAGGEWLDEETVIDENGPAPILSSRKPGDLPAFCAAMLELFARAPVAAR